MFVLPYIYSILAHNSDAAVEVMVEDAAGFVKDNSTALAIIGRAHRVLLREADFDAHDAHYMRFLRTPLTPSNYVYIGDVDVLILEGGITATHVANCAKLGLPYSNVVRPSGNRL